MVELNGTDQKVAKCIEKFGPIRPVDIAKLEELQRANLSPVLAKLEALNIISWKQGDNKREKLYSKTII